MIRVMRRSCGGAFALALLAGLAGPALAEPGGDVAVEPSPAPETARPPAPCRLPAELSLAADVRDPVFAVLLGLMDSDACGILTRARLEREVRKTGRASRIPVDYLHIMRRKRRTDGPRAEVSLISVEDIHLPVPYEILGYHPGRMHASETLVFEEWDLGTVRLDGDSGAAGIVLANVRLWGVRRGAVDMDVDGWLDRMMGGRLDDMRVCGFALFSYGGERIGLALGYGKDGSGRSGAFSFRKDTILFPAPPPLKRAGAYLRSRLERLMPALIELRRPADRARPAEPGPP